MVFTEFPLARRLSSELSSMLNYPMHLTYVGTLPCNVARQKKMAKWHNFT